MMDSNNLNERKGNLKMLLEVRKLREENELLRK